VTVPEALRADAKAKDSYVYDTVDQNGNPLPDLSVLQPIIDEIEQALGRDMSDYDAVIGNIYLPGQNISTHRDTTESLSARNYPVIVYTIGNNSGITIYENQKQPGAASFASDKKTTIPTKDGTIYTFGLDGKGRFEVAHDTPKNIKRDVKFPPITMPNGEVITNYTITLTFRRAADLEAGMPTSPAKLTTQSSTSVKPEGVEEIKIPAYTVDINLKNKDGSKRLASTKDGIIKLNPVTSVQEFFDYFEGNKPGPTSDQKKLVLSEIEKQGYSVEKIKSILNTTKLVNTFLVLHEQDHINQNDVDVYWKMGKDDFLTPDKILIETRASINALKKIESSQPSTQPIVTTEVKPIVDTIYNKEGFNYLSSQIYENFGYINKGFDISEAPKEIILKFTPVTDQDVIDFINKCFIKP
jgi:hypothetical protein